MSVFKHPRSPYWQIDFQHRGRRIQCSSGTESRRAAEAFERRLRADAAAGRLDDAAQLTLDQAAGKWWEEKGRGRADAADVERRLERLVAIIGPGRRLAEITKAVVNTAIETRRGQGFTKSPKEGARVYPLSNATVNRDIIETLRPILTRAATHWDARGLPEIPWRDLALQEPREVVRVYSEAEQEAWLRECGPEVDFALQLMLTYGLRFGELFFPPSAYDPDGPRLTWTTGRKRDVPHVIPLRADDAREVAARVGRARAAKLPHIWFVEEPDVGTAHIKLRALSYGGLEARISSAADRAGIEGGRRIHGARHHAGTTMLRQSGNLKLAQQLLGHRDIKSTMRYVHAFEDDLRAALDAPKSRNSPGQAVSSEPETTRKAKQGNE